MHKLQIFTWFCKDQYGEYHAVCFNIDNECITYTTFQRLDAKCKIKETGRNVQMTKGPPPNHHGLILFPDGFSSVFDIEGNESVTQYNRFLRINVKFSMYVLVTNITIIQRRSFIYQFNFIVIKSPFIFYVDCKAW